MHALLINAWATVTGGLSGKSPVSAVTLEFRGRPLSWQVQDGDGLRPRLTIAGAKLNFPSTTLTVLDGLLEEVQVEEAGEQVLLTAHLEHASPPAVNVEENRFFRLVWWFDRRPLQHLLRGRTVLIDPGHGGRDAGGRGPVNLLEKNVVLRSARYLDRELRAQGAATIVTRTEDIDLPAQSRFAAARAGEADLLVSLHTAHFRDPETRGIRTLYWSTGPESKQLATEIQRCLVERTGFADRGVAELQAPDPRVRIPAITVELVCISNPVEEGWLRSTTFLVRTAQAITRGIKNFLASQPTPGVAPPAASASRHTTPARVSRRQPSTAAGETRPRTAFTVHPVRTHLLSENDDMVEVVKRYTREIAEPGDVICVAESPLAITQGRAILPSSVRPGLLARFLCKFPDPDGSLGTPAAMQLAIAEVGAGRILMGALAAALGRAVGRRGDFFRVAGPAAAQIDDIAGTMPPFDRHVVMGPKDPQKVAEAIKKATGVDAVVVDVNDIYCVDILGSTTTYPQSSLEDALRTNPFGNDDQCTPIVVLKPVRPDR
ncbi:MAG TPA: hypothetical protein GX513_14525 [Firmicutes bacterium]|nr:hypothetical protein [Bacillota bacterium]